MILNVNKEPSRNNSRLLRRTLFAKKAQSAGNSQQWTSVATLAVGIPKIAQGVTIISLAMLLNACVAFQERAGGEAPVAQIGGQAGIPIPNITPRPARPPTTHVEVRPYEAYRSSQQYDEAQAVQQATAAPRTVTKHAPRPPESPVVVALLESASQEQHSGRPAIAAATLERALRIEPHNALLWHRLAAIRLAQGRTHLAVSLAQKSNSLAGNDAMLRKRNERLIAQAQRSVRL